MMSPKGPECGGNVKLSFPCGTTIPMRHACANFMNLIDSNKLYILLMAALAKPPVSVHALIH
jgi:hypothetical protein